jgi:ribosome biogenesis GTPase
MTDAPADRHPLAPFGWDERRQAQWAAAPTGTRPARVLRADRGRVTAQSTSGPVHAAAPPTRWDGEPDEVVPTTGDWVALAPASLGSDVTGGIDAPWAVAGVLPRTSRIARIDALGRDEQVLAANVDTVLIVHGLDRPLRLGRIERSLVLAWDSGAVPAIVLTKADLADDVAEVAARLAGSAGDTPVHVVSSTTGTGLDQVRAHLHGGRTAVVLGESGSGKSTLVNALVGAAVQATGEVRAGDAKGRHTTVTRDLVAVPGGGVVIDTPGLRSLGMWDAGDGVALAYADIDELATGCRFRDCGHQAEPGCAVRAAEARGDLAHDRVERYLQLGQEVAAAEARREAQAQLEAKRPRRAAPRPRPRGDRSDDPDRDDRTDRRR